MGVGSNPAAWFVVIASILVLGRVWLATLKEAPMTKLKYKSQRTNPKAQGLFKLIRSGSIAFIETTLAIATSFAAGLVVHLIHAKGAPR
jgi:hypothetical protein